MSREDWSLHHHTPERRLSLRLLVQTEMQMVFESYLMKIGHSGAMKPGPLSNGAAERRLPCTRGVARPGGGGIIRRSPRKRRDRHQTLCSQSCRGRRAVLGGRTVCEHWLWVTERPPGVLITWLSLYTMYIGKRNYGDAKSWKTYLFRTVFLCVFTIFFFPAFGSYLFLDFSYNVHREGSDGLWTGRPEN